MASVERFWDLRGRFGVTKQYIYYCSNSVKGVYCERALTGTVPSSVLVAAVKTSTTRECFGQRKDMRALRREGKRALENRAPIRIGVVSRDVVPPIVGRVDRHSVLIGRATIVWFEPVPVLICPSTTI